LNTLHHGNIFESKLTENYEENICACESQVLEATVFQQSQGEEATVFQQSQGEELSLAGIYVCICIYICVYIYSTVQL
jgi:hypothetical protein